MPIVLLGFDIELYVIVISSIIIGVSSLKMISFGPRPFDFLACNAPIKPLYNLGVEVMENSELDLFELFNKHADDVRIPELTDEMAADLGQNRAIDKKVFKVELSVSESRVLPVQALKPGPMQG